MWPFKKREPKKPEPVYTITSIVSAEDGGGWNITYEGDGEMFSNSLYRVHWSGRIAPAPNVGDEVRRVWEFPMHGNPRLLVQVNGYGHQILY